MFSAFWPPARPAVIARVLLRWFLLQQLVPYTNLSMNAESWESWGRFASSRSAAVGHIALLGTCELPAIIVDFAAKPLHGILKLCRARVLEPWMCCPHPKGLQDK